MKASKFASFASLAFVIAASTSDASPNSYRVSFTQSQDGHPFATPELVVNPGIPAAIEVAGPNSFRFDVTVENAGEGMVKVGMHLATKRMSTSPVLIAKLGETVAATVGDSGGGELGISLIATAADR
jgi:hypothetical protein